MHGIQKVGGSDPSAADSQDDSQAGEQPPTNVDDLGFVTVMFDLEWTSLDDPGRRPGGLQNRLRGAVEASWVGSIPIHPRQFWLE